LIEDGSTHAPAKERFDRLQGLVGGDRRAPLLDGGDDLNNIALANLVDALPAQVLPISRRRSLAISPPERFCDKRCAMKASNRSSTPSATIRRLAARFSAAGSRPSSFAANTFCAATRA
jgi:hypothetical protein